MYETMAVMAVWETDPSFAEGPPLARDDAQLWQAADKVVSSSTLDQVITTRTRLERTFDPDRVRQLVASADRDAAMGRAELAGHASRAGLVDECCLLLTPVIVGGSEPAVPAGARLDLELLDERRQAAGAVFLRYQVT